MLGCWDVYPMKPGSPWGCFIGAGMLEFYVLTQVPVELRSVNMKSALEIAMRFQIYAYDAFFLECAYSLRLPFITLDRGMCRVAQKMGVSIVE